MSVWGSAARFELHDGSPGEVLWVFLPDESNWDRHRERLTKTQRAMFAAFARRIAEYLDEPNDAR